MSISSFSSHLMMSLQGDELHFFVSGISSIENPPVKIIDLTSTKDIETLDKIAQNHYSSVVLSVYSPHKTIVPEGIFDPNNLKDYMEYNFGDNGKNSLLHSDYIDQLESHLVYNTKNNIEAITTRFPSLRIKHAVSILLEVHLRSSIASQSVEVSVYTEGKYIDLIVSDKKDLLYSNSFNVFNAEDFTYYVVYVLDILGISVKDTLIRLCGDTPIDGFDLLKKYCPMAGFHRFEYDSNLGKSISKNDYAREAILLNQYQCV